MSNSTGGRVPSLDGIRAISILMVLYGHLSGTRHFPVSNPGGYGRWFGDVAHLGVLVFFVISGFLITSLLKSERGRTGTISLKRFYLRRILRIFPAFYAYILILATATLLGMLQLTGRDFAFAVAFAFNYSPSHPWLLGHLWSLSIEEQFYLLWPLLLVSIRERPALIVAIAATFASALLRAAMRIWVLHAGPNLLSKMTTFPGMCDYLAAGCALALLRPWLLTQGWYLRLTASRWLVLTVPLVLLINRVGSDPVAILLGSPVTNVCLALLIESSTRHAGSMAGRFLNWKPVVLLGTLSYSLYLWQEIFLDRGSGRWLNAFPQNMVFAFLAALASYFLIERSCVHLRGRLRCDVGLPVRVQGIACGENVTFEPAVPAASRRHR
ncbi:MAG TPA: acyltransferase [Rhodanobacter sp.]